MMAFKAINTCESFWSQGQKASVGLVWALWQPWCPRTGKGGGGGGKAGETAAPCSTPCPSGLCKHFTPRTQQADLQKGIGDRSHIFQHSGSSREVIFERSHFVFTHLSIGCYALLGVWSSELLLRPACPPGRWRYPAPYFATPQWLHLPALININLHKSGVYCREAEHWSQLL